MLIDINREGGFAMRAVFAHLSVRRSIGQRRDGKGFPGKILNADIEFLMKHP